MESCFDDINLATTWVVAWTKLNPTEAGAGFEVNAWKPLVMISESSGCLFQNEEM